jgi:transcriptional regulator with XRE-family HTH domain
MPDNIQSATSLDRILGGLIRERREALGLSQGNLSAKVGVTYQQMHKYERGANRICVARLVDIARHLDITPGDLLQAAVEQTEGITPDRGRRRRTLELARAAADLPPDVQSALASLARTLQPHATSAGAA